MLKKILRYFALAIYYGFVRYLPDRFPLSLQLRRLLSKAIFKKCGKLSCVCHMAYIGTGAEIELGDYSSIGHKAYIAGIGAGGKLKIGNYVLMAPEVIILTVSPHSYDDPNIPICYQKGNFYQKVVIEDDVLIGIRTTIMPGVTIGKGSVVGAGAVITRNVDPYSIVGGVPARVIKMRQ